MYYVEIKDDVVVGKSYNSFSEGMIKIKKELYDMIKSIPAKIERDNQGEIVDVIPIEESSEPEKPTLEEFKKQESAESIKIQALEIKVKRLEEMINERR